MRLLYKTSLCILFFGSQLKAQLTTTQTLTPQQLVQTVLLGSGVTASNITYAGSALQIARFNATPSTNLGLLYGMFLSTGNASTSSPVGPQGPNNATGLSNDTQFGNPGDADLDALSTVNTEDAAILEFDFTPTGDSVKFRYCFASEEYMEFVSPGGGINDAFAFLLTGPNPAGGNYVNHNIALLPGSTTPVSIQNVNANVNPAFYRSNSSNIINCEFDGYTVILTALEKVVCGQTYHIKIAIADGGDDQVDSGVFLEGGSFSSLPPLALNTTNANSNVPDSILVEDCNTNCINFIRNGNISLADSFNLQITGNAILGTDYIQTGNPGFTWPNKIVFAPNQDTVKFCNLTALQDNITEGIDTIKFTMSSFVTSTLSCLSSNAINFNLYVYDYTPISIAQNDVILCTGQSTILNASPSGGYPAYTYSITPSSVTTATLNTGPVTGTTVYTITVNDVCNKPISKEITVSAVPVPTVITTDTTICGGSSATVSATGADTYIWNTGAVNDSITVTPQVTTNYTVTGSVGTCTSSAVATVSVINQNISISGNNLLCDGSTSTLIASGGSSYLWSTGETTPSIAVTPTTTTIYTVQSFVGSCPFTAVYTVSVTSTPTLTFAAPIVCPNQTTVIEVFGATTYTWSNGAMSNSITVNVPVSTTYTVTGALGTTCTNTAVYTLTVVPTPTVLATNTVICAGSSASLSATGADSYVWNTGLVNDTLIVNPTTTTNYTVIGSVGSCTNFAVATATVINPSVSIIGNNNICAGQSTTLTAIGGTSFSWNTGAITNSIVVTPSVTAIYNVISMFGFCPTGDTYTVSVSPNPTVTTIGTSICPGQNGVITASGATTYSWSTGATTNSINVNPAINTTYTVVGTSFPSCKDTAMYTVNVITTQPILNPFGPLVLCIDTLNEIPVIVSSGNPPYNISWTDPVYGSITHDTASNVFYFVQYRIPANATYTFIVTDQCNYSDTIEVQIETIDCNIIIPNVVTSNGDGVNDYFRINGLENYPGTNLTVFSRWGNKVYNSDDYKNDWKPEENSGTYFYSVTLTDGRKFSGFFQLFKD